MIPKARRHGLRLLVTPDTILRWHRDIVRRRWAARSIRACGPGRSVRAGSAGAAQDGRTLLRGKVITGLQQAGQQLGLGGEGTE